MAEAGSVPEALRLCLGRPEELQAIALKFAERPAVEFPKQFVNGLIEFTQAEEAPLAQSCQDPALHDQNGRFDFFPCPGEPAPGPG